MVVLAALPVLVLTFFSFAVMLALFAVVAVIGTVRLAWHRYRGRAAPAHRRAPQRDDADTFTVAVRDITDRAPAVADEIQPRPQVPPPSSPPQ